ncbi:MAG TPA: family 20 glycosylhydrolase [Vicinamibacteria bacterium]|nr:family 20 glycosylhydrolase [Vicinamibacteria bacterium]
MRGFSILVPLLIALPAAAAEKAKAEPPWVALHLLGYQSDADLASLENQLPDLATRGVNVLVLEVDYGFAFRSHPELRIADTAITRTGARRFVAACRKRGIRVIPEFQSFGHQSWARDTWPLLTKYPELDLTPGAFPRNEGIYCREWDPMNPRVVAIATALIDEIVDAFDADTVHVGMDEVFLIGNDASPSTKGKDPAEVYAKAVNDLHAHVVKKRGLRMMMWGDRLIDASRYDYGEWESSRNHTWPAIYMIPRDIVIADWHYEKRDSYPSLGLFLDKGFRVLPTSFKDVEASRALIEYGRGLKRPGLLGHLFTSWEKVAKPADWPPLAANASLVAAAVAGGNGNR